MNKDAKKFATMDELWQHRNAHTEENSRWLRDVRGVPLYRVCDECAGAVKMSYEHGALPRRGDIDVKEPVKQATSKADRVVKMVLSEGAHWVKSFTDVMIADVAREDRDLAEALRFHQVATDRLVAACERRWNERSRSNAHEAEREESTGRQ